MDWKKIVREIEIKDEMKDELLRQCKRNKHVPNLLFRYSKAAAAAAAVVICLAGSVTVYAAVNAYQARLDAMDDKEITEHYDFAQIGTPDADSWSRPLTQSERERMDELKSIFEQGERFPEGEIGTTGEEGDFYYEADIRMFHLPEEELTDEQLLEILDLWAKLDYSLQKKNEELGITAEDAEPYSGTVEKTEDDHPAYVRAKEVMESILGKDISTMETEVRFWEKVTESSNDSYTVRFEDETITYQVMFKVYDGVMDTVPYGIECWKDKEMPQAGAPTEEQVEHIYQKAKTILKDSIGVEGTIVAGTCLYYEQDSPYIMEVVIEMENGDRYLMEFAISTEKMKRFLTYEKERYGSFEFINGGETVFEME